MNGHILTLRFPPPIRYASLLAALIGAAAIVYWGVPVYMRDAPVPPTGAFGLMLLAPIGVGFLLMSHQRVTVTDESIESRFLGIRKTVDFRSARVLKTRSNGFLMSDARGTKLFINHWMIGCGELYDMIASHST